MKSRYFKAKHAKFMALCLEDSVIFTPHGKNQCRNLVNVQNLMFGDHLLGCSDGRHGPMRIRQHDA